MTLAAQANLYCVRADVEAILSAEGVSGRLDDDGQEAPDVAEELAFDYAINLATSRVKMHLQGHYADADLAASWVVNQWAAVIAAHWLCGRRGNPVPDSIKQLMYGDGTGNNLGVMGELAGVRAGLLAVPDIGKRNVDFPGWSVSRVDPNYRQDQLRTVRKHSEPTAAQHPRRVDWPSEYSYEW